MVIFRGRKLNGFAVGLVLGGVLAMGLCVVVFFNRPARAAVDKLQRIVGLKASNDDPGRAKQRKLYAVMPPRHTINTDWGGVKSPAHPQWLVRRGYDVERVATGLTYPVNIAFAQDTPATDDQPMLYVTELHGSVRYVTRTGEIGTFAADLNNFEPIPRPETDQTGITGICTTPNSRDLLVTSCYKDTGSGLLKNRVLRLVASDDGKTMKECQILLDLDEFTAPAHQIQQILVGPDNKLWLSVGDGENPLLAQDLTKFGGKILRLNLDGTACEDNPFYDPAHASSPKSYIYALGLRNVFDFDHHPTTGQLYAADNGYRIDRLVGLTPGQNAGWNGDPDSTRLNALYTWGPIDTISPTGVTFLHHPVLGQDTQGRLYIGAFNRHEADKRPFAQSLMELVIDPQTGRLTRQPEHLVQHDRSSIATVIGVTEGPDGLYFTDLWGEVSDGRTAGKGNIWKVIPSQATLHAPAETDAKLAKLAPAQRGRIHFLKNCTTCHRVDGNGGTAGPELSHARANLDMVLNSAGYNVTLDKLIQSEQSYFVQQRPRLQAVRSAQGEKRIRVWLDHHLAEPRFDNPMSQMPPFGTLSNEVRRDLIEYLMTLE